MKLALIFPGQGSQSVGMMGSFADVTAVRETFVEASDILGQDMWQLAAEGPVEELNSTVNTQPLMLTAGYAVYRAWTAAGGESPVILAGHSLGEYTALVAAGVMAFKDALPLVRFRAQSMQEAVPVGTGGMAAILGLDDESVRKACSDAAQGEVVEAVNFNAPSQVVIAGHKAAVERAAALAKSMGAKRAVLLPVSAPFHSSLLKPAADRLEQYLETVAVLAPKISVINNVDVQTETVSAKIRNALARQACNPVRWVEVIKAIASTGVTHVAECGPGKVLAGMTKRIDGNLHGLALADATSLEQAMQTLRQAA
jgi:[acyl-carrier-protein] S-malonyltransferase